MRTKPKNGVVEWWKFDARPGPAEPKLPWLAIRWAADGSVVQHCCATEVERDALIRQLRLPASREVTEEG